MMSVSCDLTATVSVMIQVVVMVVVNGVALLFTLSSIPLFICSNTIDYSLRQILASFQLANLVGIGVTTYETLISICGDESLELTSISILLVLGHIISLLVAEHTIITKKGSGERFEALILASWLLSITIGLLCGRLPLLEHRYVGNVVLSIWCS